MHPFIPLEDFLRQLRDNGFPVGIDTHLRVQALLDRLPADTPVSRLGGLLCPIFARSEKEQQRFLRLFEAYCESWATQPAAPPRALTGTRVSRPRAASVRAFIASRWLFLCLALIVSALLVSLVIGAYQAIQGQGDRPGAMAYLKRYSLDDPKYLAWNISKYVAREILHQPQPCDLLEDAGIAYTARELENGSFEVQFASLGSDSVSSRTWSYGTGQRQANVLRPVFVYADSGSYQVKLEIANAAGCRVTISSLVRLVSTRSCQAAFVYQTSASNPQSVSFQDSSILGEGDRIIRWAWKMGDDAGSTDSVTAPAFTFSAYREYKVCLRIETERGCTDEFCKVIRIAPPTDTLRLLPLPTPPVEKADITPLRVFPLTPYIPLFLVIVLAVGGFFYEWYKHARRRYLLDRKRSQDGPFTWAVKLPFALPVFAADAIHKAAVHLRRRQESDIRVLNVPATIEATIRAGGYPTFSYQAGTRPPEYLVLIERRTHRDHQAWWFQTLTAALAAQDVFTDIYYFPPEMGGYTRTPQDKPMTLQELATRYPEHRLLVMGDGAGLLDPISGDPTAECLAMQAWQDRAILTPRSPADWSLAEITLARSFVLLPAGTEPLSTLLTYFDPEVVRKTPVWKLTGPGANPDEEDWHQPDILRAYLGEPLYTWLAACAVYPECQWDLTLYLGWCLQEFQVAPLLTEENLLRLIRLPFFRTGQMPDELRQTLIGTLPPEVLRRVREGIIELLEKNPPPAQTLAAERHRNHLALQQWELAAETNSPNAQLRQEIEALAERNEVDDPVVLQHLQQGKGSPLAIRLTDNLRGVLFRDGMAILGTRAWIRYTLGLAAIAILMIPVIRQFTQDTDFNPLLEATYTRGGLVKYENQYYRLRNGADSAVFFSYVGGQFMDKHDYGSAYNNFARAQGLDPLTPLYYYQRGLAHLYIARAQGDSLLPDSYRDFLRAAQLSPLYTEGFILGPQVRIAEPQLADACLIPDKSGIIQHTGQEITVRWLDAVTPPVQISHPVPVSCMAVSHDSRYLVTGGGTEAYLWDIHTGQRLQTFRGHTGMVLSAAFSTDDAYVVTGAMDKSAIVWNRASGVRIHDLIQIHTDAVLDASFSPDNQYVVTASGDSTCAVWNNRTGEFVADFLLAGKASKALFLPDSRWVLAASPGGVISLWSMNGTELLTLRTGLEQIRSMRLSPDGSAVALCGWPAGGSRVVFQLWDIPGQRMLSTLEVPPFQQPANAYPTPPANTGGNLSFSATGGDLLAAVPGEGVQLISGQAGRQPALKRQAVYSSALVLYEQRLFDEARQRFSRLQGHAASELTAYGQGMAGLMAARRARSGEDASNRLLTALKDLDQAPDMMQDSLNIILPTILDLYEYFLEVRKDRGRICEFIERYKPGGCSVFAYNEIQPYSEGLAAVRSGERWGYIDSTQRLVIPIQYTEPAPFVNGLAEVRIPPGMPGAGTYVIINRSNTVLFRQVGKPGDNLRAVQDAQSRLWGYMNGANQLVIAAQYQEAWPFYLGFARVKVNNLYGLIDQQGDASYYGGIRYSRMDRDFRSGEVVQAWIGKEQVALTHPTVGRRAETIPAPTMQEIQPMQDLASYQLVGTPSEGMQRIISQGKYGFIAVGQMTQQTSQSGSSSVQISCQYENAYDFSYGRAAVKLPDGLWGYIDIYGKAVIPFQYEEAAVFAMKEKKALALVTQGGQSYYIGLSGECIPYANLSCPSTPSKSVQPRSNIPAYTDPETGLTVFNQHGKWGLRRSEKDIILEPTYNNPFVFKEGYARVQSNNRWGFIRPDGSLLTALIYEDVQDFSESLAAVRRGDKWGYINTEGKVVIPIRFDEARAFARGKAIVRIGKGSFRIDKRGFTLSNARQ
ncbi:MAG: WG repeat-containing protein [Bacteroidia bacterium]|nr:WG repeat-containing protein [Bacteroidia bacterium]